MAIVLPSLHFVSVMIMSHSVALFLALSLCWVWLRWRRYQQRGWAVLLGVAAGWGAITRPFDVLCFAVPIAVAMSLDVYQRQPRSRVFRHWLGTLAAVLVGAIPLLAVQVLLILVRLVMCSEHLPRLMGADVLADRGNGFSARRPAIPSTDVRSSSSKSNDGAAVVA